METNKLIQALHCCGNSPGTDRCKQDCAYFGGTDLSRCIPGMTEDAAARLEQLQAENEALRAEIQARGWTSTKERMPELGQRVVISWGQCVDVAEYWRRLICPHWRTQRYGTIDLIGVTHWMPLPAPPKEG